MTMDETFYGWVGSSGATRPNDRRVEGVGHRILEDVVITELGTIFIGWQCEQEDHDPAYPYRYYPKETEDYAGYAILLDDDLATFYFGIDLLSEKAFVPVPPDLTLEEAQAWAIGYWRTSS